MSLYDDVLNCPDTHCRRETLDKLCKEKIAEGMIQQLDAMEKNRDPGEYIRKRCGIREAVGEKPSRKKALDALIAEQMGVQASIYLTFDDLPDMQLTPKQAKELRDALIEIVGLPEWVVLSQFVEGKLEVQ